MKKKILLSFVLTLALLLLVPNTALAIPQKPHQFYGTVTIGGVSAEDDLLVEAKIDGVPYGTCHTHNGEYGNKYDSVTNLMKVTADDPDTAEIIEGGVNGDTVEFYVDGTKANEEATFEVKGYTEFFNLTVGAPTYTITFDTDPEATGSITFDGVSYSDGDTVSKTAATYDIVADSGSGYTFSIWETTGDLSVAAPSSATTTCDVSGVGTLRMVQTTAPPTEYTVTFDTDPEATGSITFDGVSYSDGDTASKTAGTYDIEAAPGSGYTFDSWETTGDLSVAAPSSTTTTCDVSGVGTLRMVQTTTPPPEYTVTFDTDPEATGSITFDGVSYSDGDTASKTAGTYDIEAAPGSGYTFDSWETTGDLSVAAPSSTTTTCVVSGEGTLRMVQTTTYYTLTVDVIPSGGGDVEVNGVTPSSYPYTKSFSEGSSIDLEAVPAIGYAFRIWSGDTGDIEEPDSAPTTIHMNGNYSIQANFVLFSAPANVGVSEVDAGVESIDVSAKDLGEVDTTEMPEDIEAQEAYMVDSTGEGSFTLRFSDIANAESIVVYKVTDSGEWIELTATGSGTTLEVTIPAGDPPIVFCTPTGAPPPVGGTVYPSNNLALLAPWIGLGIILAGGITWLVIRRRRA